ncbi:hypothetical protein [Acinetobacter phage ABPH49]|nr:hypothetical protein [Acinetobacter phage ABPH49]
MHEVMNPIMDLIDDICDGNTELAMKALVLCTATLLAQNDMDGVEIGVAGQKITVTIEEE